MKSLLLLLFFFIFTPVPSAQAQIGNIGVAHSYPVAESDIVAGDIVSTQLANEPLTRSKTPYDERMFGVVVDSAPLVFRTKSGYPVMQNGTIIVNATTLNGPIGIGDYVTTSQFAGKAQKVSERRGFLLGRALTGLNENEGTPVTFEGKNIRLGKIKVAIGIGPTGQSLPAGQGSMFETVNRQVFDLFIGLQSTQGQDKRARYILAGIVALSIIFINFLTLGKNITRGIESIGRNPLARMSIQSMIVLNIALIVIISIGGIVLSLAILTF